MTNALESGFQDAMTAWNIGVADAPGAVPPVVEMTPAETPPFEEPPPPLATDIEWSDEAHTVATGTINGQRWCGITAGHPFWMSIQAALDAGATAKPYPVEEHRRQEERAKIEWRLMELDRFAVRPLRATAVGLGTPVDEIILDALDAEAADLRARLAELA